MAYLAQEGNLEVVFKDFSYRYTISLTESVGRGS